MLTEPRPGILDLLVLGGATIDRFADGSSTPGGSVVHATRSAARRGLRVGVVTAAGPEAEAQAGLAELRQLAADVEVATHAATSTFRHDDSPGGRRLWLERTGGPIEPAADVRHRMQTRATLFAPIFDEVHARSMPVREGPSAQGAILQGWVRAVTEDREVVYRALSALGDRLRDALGRLDLVVASREDLLAEGNSPAEQLTALRAALGSGPALVVTEGPQGLWLDVRGDREHLSVAWLVEDVPTVGAGDVLAAFLTMGADDPPGGWRAHALRAMRVVAETLDERKAS